jgi:hypothetical protein
MPRLFEERLSVWSYRPGLAEVVLIAIAEGVTMPARGPQVKMFVLVIGCLGVAATREATAQALCPPTDAQAIELALLRSPETTTVEGDLPGEMPPGDTWHMPVSPEMASDGLALEGVALTRRLQPGPESTAQTFEIVVEFRAADRILVNVELALIDGKHSLPLGTIKEIPVRCEAKTVSQTMTISAGEFASYFAKGKNPKLRVTRTSFVGGC